MIRNFKTKNTDGRLIIQKIFFGFGFHLDMHPPIASRKKRFQIILDFIFIRFWITLYK